MYIFGYPCNYNVYSCNNMIIHTNIYETIEKGSQGY